jgi:Predicted nucleic acid-binding protein, consists of a PIN domain and a Zn-ribbon module
MTYICPECKSEIPSDSDFCYICGRKVKLSDPSYNSHSNVCISCGNELSGTELFCGKCGLPITKNQMVNFKPKITTRGKIGIIFAALPGIVGVFGLGHLILGKFSRGGIYILMSAFFLYSVFLSETTELMKNIMIAFMVFLYVLQIVEVIGLAMMPQKTTK